MYFISSFGPKREERYSILEEILFSVQILFPHFLRKFGQAAATWLLPGFVLVPRTASHSWISLLEEELEQGTKFTLRDHVTFWHGDYVAME